MNTVCFDLNPNSYSQPSTPHYALFCIYSYQIQFTLFMYSPVKSCSLEHSHSLKENGLSLSQKPSAVNGLFCQG